MGPVCYCCLIRACCCDQCDYVFWGRLEGCCYVGGIGYHPSALAACREQVGEALGMDTFISFLGQQLIMWGVSSEVDLRMHCLLPHLAGGNRCIETFLLLDSDLICPGDFTPRLHRFHFCGGNNDKKYCCRMHPPLLYSGIPVLHDSWIYNCTYPIQCTR